MDAGGREEGELEDREVGLCQLEETDEVIGGEECQRVWYMGTPGYLD